jgi:aryl-alcohol dehydrogenase-like predicted oxidoreductase
MSRRSASRREFLEFSAALSLAAWSSSGCARPASAVAAQALVPEPLEHRPFGKTDMRVAVLGFGGAEIGYEKTDKATVAKLLNAALDAGLNVVDTAECYLDSEIAIGETIGSRRKEYYLFTKCGHITPDGKRGDDWTKEGVLKSVERSLKRLKTDVIDLVQLHSCSLAELKKGACIEGLLEAKKQGKARYIGYSGDSLAAKWAVESGQFDALQTSINIADQECIELVLPPAKERRMGVVAKRPIANAAWRYDSKPDSGYHEEYWRRLRELKYEWATGDARKKEGLDGPAAIAMRFTAMQPGVSVLIVGTTKPERWKQNADLMRAGPLPDELAAAIRARWKAVAGPEWVGQT